MLARWCAPLLFAAPIVCSAQEERCTQLRTLIGSTYDFRPSRLTDAQRKAKSGEMERVWNMVRADSTDLAPCLIAETERPGADPWFVYDAGGLLASFEQSARANTLMLRGCGP